MSDTEKSRERIAAVAARWVARRDAGLLPDESRDFDRWRAADPRHAEALERYSAAWSVLDRPRHADAIMRELGVRRRRSRRRLIAGAGAMAVALGLIATTVPSWRRGLTDQPVAVAQPGGVLFAPEKRVLPDGSIIELKSGAEVAVRFTDALRRVVLVRGEAHFDVVKDPERPFAVDAGAVQVRAVGTAFTVQRDVEQIEVVVTEGRVALEQTAPAAAPPSTTTGAEKSATTAHISPLAIADAGQRVVLPTATRMDAPAVIPVTAEELAARMAWRAPRVEFSATPLAEALAMMNRSVSGTAGGLQLVIDPSLTGLAKEPISGIFRADNTETFVRMLELSLGIQAERRGNQIVLRKGR